MPRRWHFWHVTGLMNRHCAETWKSENRASGILILAEYCQHEKGGNFHCEIINVLQNWIWEKRFVGSLCARLNQRFTCTFQNWVFSCYFWRQCTVDTVSSRVETWRKDLFIAESVRDVWRVPAWPYLSSPSWRAPLVPDIIQCLSWPPVLCICVILYFCIRVSLSLCTCNLGALH